METMIDYMGTENSTGINNLVHSWDIVTWWAVYAFRTWTNHRSRTNSGGSALDCGHHPATSCGGVISRISRIDSMNSQTICTVSTLVGLSNSMSG